MKKEGRSLFIGYYNKSVILTYIGIIISIIGMFHLENTDMALICLILAGICDLFDGAIARRCKRSEAEKAFGVQLDSLADTVCFLVFPAAILLYAQEYKVAAVIVTGIYLLAGITRLGWFNVNADTETLYYDGLPVTYSALIIPIAMMILDLAKINHWVFRYGILLGLSFFYIANIKIKKPGGIWYMIFPALAIITITIIQLT